MLKRSGFKKKSYEEVSNMPNKARTPLKRSGIATKKKNPVKSLTGDKKKVSVTSLKNKLWKIISKRIKERDNYICFTSGKKVEGSNAHCGHGTSSSVCGGRLRYHPKNLHCQSYNENINLGGNGRVYYQRQIEKYGKEKVDFLDSLQHVFIKVDSSYYLSLIELYSNGSWEEIESFLEK